jgi:hypothetical protein
VVVGVIILFIFFIVGIFFSLDEALNPNLSRMRRGRRLLRRRHWHFSPNPSPRTDRGLFLFYTICFCFKIWILHATARSPPPNISLQEIIGGTKALWNTSVTLPLRKSSSGLTATSPKGGQKYLHPVRQVRYPSRGEFFVQYIFIYSPLEGWQALAWRGGENEWL